MSIYNNREVIGRVAVRTDDNQVIQLFIADMYIPIDLIAERDCAALRVFKAQDIRTCFGA